MKELIQYISSSIVDDPTQVKVTQQSRGSHVTLKLQVAREDMGRVIGKGGRVASALRTLLKVVATQEGKRATLNILEPE